MSNKEVHPCIKLKTNDLAKHNYYLNLEIQFFILHNVLVTKVISSNGCSRFSTVIQTDLDPANQQNFHASSVVVSAC